MGRQTVLITQALELAGVPHKFVSGWQTRGSLDFMPVGVTWHATAGSATSSAEGEVNVLLHGSATAPPPIAQFMIARDGVVWVIASGRCNHNKVGWAGPNKGLGNSNLFGIEMQNDNRGQAWPTAQLVSARVFTAALFRLMQQDPLKRLAGHYEHQPYEGRPPGETSTKSDPYGVNMRAEREKVRTEMENLDMPTPGEIAEAVWAHRYGDAYPSMGVMQANSHEQESGFDSKTKKNTGGGFSDWLSSKKHAELVGKIDGVMEDNDRTQTAVANLQTDVIEMKGTLEQILMLLTPTEEEEEDNGNS